jgi:hypothetical protein
MQGLRRSSCLAILILGQDDQELRDDPTFLPSNMLNFSAALELYLPLTRLAGALLCVVVPERKSGSHRSRRYMGRPPEPCPVRELLGRPTVSPPSLSA